MPRSEGTRHRPPSAAGPGAGGGEAGAGSGAYPRFGRHSWPRTRAGAVALTTFLVLFAFTQPPLVFALANRIEPRLLGLPFLYAYLLALYGLLILALLWARLRDL
ncbi:MAG: hypothetical protein ACRELC_02655 [Gemmatimonadota bacterium]